MFRFSRSAARSLKPSSRLASRRVSSVQFRATASTRTLATAAASAVLAGAAVFHFADDALRCFSEATITDKLSNLQHPVELVSPIDNKHHQVVGCGTRAVTFLSYYVYSVALYLSQSELGKFQQANLSDDELCQRAITTDRCLRIAPYRKAAFSHLRDGFTRALESRLRFAELNDADKTLAIEQLATFKKAFPRDNLDLGDELLFFIYNNTVSMVFKDKVLLTLESAFIARNLCLNYLDNDTVSASARDDMMQGMRRLSQAAS